MVGPKLYLQAVLPSTLLLCACLALPAKSQNGLQNMLDRVDSVPMQNAPQYQQQSMPQIQGQTSMQNSMPGGGQYPNQQYMPPQYGHEYRQQGYGGQQNYSQSGMQGQQSSGYLMQPQNNQPINGYAQTNQAKNFAPYQGQGNQQSSMTSGQAMMSAATPMMAPASPYGMMGANPLAGLFGGGASAAQSPANGRMNLLKIFLGGSPSSSGSNYQQQQANNASASANAEENLQTALDQASQAQGAAARASSGTDKGARMSAAEEARYAAGSARAAADRAQSAAGNANGGNAAGIAARASAAADRAQAAADRATANAENFVEHNHSGW